MQQIAVRSLTLEDGVALQYAESTPSGDSFGTLVLFVHGSPGSWQSFERVMRDPMLEGVHQISVDRLGWGGSRLTEGAIPSGSKAAAQPSLKVQADAIRQLLETIDPKKTVIAVGHSLGAPIAARAAMDAPGLIDGLVLAAGSIDPAQEKTTWYQAIGRSKIVRWMLPRSLVAADEEMIPLQTELQAMVPYWQEIQTPVIVLQGEKDRLVPAENVAFAERMLTAADLQIEWIPERGHLLHVRESARIAMAIRRLATQLEEE